MKTYKVEVTHDISKHARTVVEANSEKEAIEKARQLEWKDFNETAASNQTIWRVDTRRTLFEHILSIFGLGSEKNF